MPHVSPMKRRDFIKLLRKNGFEFDRTSGDHLIYINDKGVHISIPYGNEINAMLARRLIKENNLRDK